MWAKARGGLSGETENAWFGSLDGGPGIVSCVFMDAAGGKKQCCGFNRGVYLDCVCISAGAMAADLEKAKDGGGTVFAYAAALFFGVLSGGRDGALSCVWFLGGVPFVDGHCQCGLEPFDGGSIGVFLDWPRPCGKDAPAAKGSS